MALLTEDELRELAEDRDGLRASIYMLTRLQGPETRENHIRFKNQLEEIRGQLREEGLNEPEISEFLEPAMGLVREREFWRHQVGGLAVFLAGERFDRYELPLNFQPKAILGRRYHLKPLIPYFSRNGRFYLLVLGEGGVRVMRGTHWTVREIEAEDMPGGLADTLQFDVPEESLQWHIATRGGGAADSPGAAVYHGHGVTKDPEAANLRRYFEEIDNGMQKLLRKEQAPLVLAGMERVQGLYRKSNHYKYLVEQGVPGNPDELTDRELHDRAWELVEPILLEDHREAAERCAAARGTQKGSGNLKEIVPAAHNARAETLFVAEGAVRWGRFDPEEQEVELHAERQPEDEDLLDAAAVEAISHGGDVYVVAADQVPGGGEICAVFRW